MTNKELQSILQKYPDDTPIWISNPVQGDCENCKEATPKDIYFDNRYPAIVLM